MNGDDGCFLIHDLRLCGEVSESTRLSISNRDRSRVTSCACSSIVCAWSCTCVLRSESSACSALFWSCCCCCLQCACLWASLQNARRGLLPAGSACSQYLQFIVLSLIVTLRSSTRSSHCNVTFT